MMTDLKTPCPLLPVPLGQNEALQKRMSHQFISFTREVLYILGKVCKNQFFSLFNCTFTIKCVQARGGLTIFMRSKWLLDLHCIAQYFGLFQWEKIIFCQNTYFCLKMIFRPCYFYFFSHFVSGVGTL